MTGKRSSEEQDAIGAEDTEGNWRLRQIEDALRGLRFGTLTLIVQDGVLIQLERTEKRRFDRGKAKK